MRGKTFLAVAAVLAGILATRLVSTPVDSAAAPSTVAAGHPAASAPATRSSRVADDTSDTPSLAEGRRRIDAMPATRSGSALVPVPELALDVNLDSNVDLSRLSDPAYETDPDLVRLAEGHGLTAPCLLAQVRLRTTGIPVGDACDIASWTARHDRLHVLPGTYEERCDLRGAQVICRTERVAAHPFEALGNHELESLALSFPEAAVLLARRSTDPAVSEHYYEQAVALSGRPGPLLEWMGHTGVGGLEFHGGHLDVGKATLGYEIYLVMTAFDHGRQAADGYADALLDAGVELAPIRQRADERLERLHRLRLSLRGSGWEE